MKVDRKKEIVFYNPSNSLGGAELLFSRLADRLADKGVSIYYVDYSSGYARTNYNGTKVKFIIKDDSHKILLPIGSTVILPANYIFHVKSLITNYTDLHFVFWMVHPLNVISNLFLFKHITLLAPRVRKIVGRQLKELTDSGALFFMDYSTYITNSNFFDFKLSKRCYLPIPIEIPLEPIVFNKQTPIDFLPFRIAWLGRIDGDKYRSIELIIMELESYSQTSSIEFYIIGIGSELDRLKDLASKMNFPIYFTGKLVNTDLKDFIANKVDLGVAMGTSALEIAKLRKPVVMIDLYDKKYKANTIKYSLLHQIYEYSLGSLYPLLDGEKRNYRFKDVMDLVLNDYDHYADLDYQYVKQNHDIDNVTLLLYNKIYSGMTEGQNSTLQNLDKLEEVYLVRKKSIIYKTIIYIRLFLRKFN